MNTKPTDPLAAVAPATTCSALVRWVEIADRITMNPRLCLPDHVAKLLNLVEIVVECRHIPGKGYHWQASLWNRDGEREMKNEYDAVGPTPEIAIENVLLEGVKDHRGGKYFERPWVVALGRALQIYRQNASGEGPPP